MPTLDVSDVLFSPEFMDRTLVRRRNIQTVSSGGIASNAPADTPFSGVVTNDTGDILERFPEGEYVKGSIMVHSRLPLTAGNDAASLDADLVQWKGSWYTVANLADYTSYGRGFTCALCTPRPLGGA